MTGIRYPRLAAAFMHPAVAAMIVVAAWPAVVSLPAAAQAQTQSSQGSSGGWHHFGQDKASSASASDPFATLEREMYELINRDRARNPGPTDRPLPPLRWNDRLAAAARAHSRDMVARGYFGHVDPEARSPGLRLKAAGIAWQAVGENIALDTGVKTAESAFMSEPAGGQNHRSNILSREFTDVGVGITAGPGGLLYITQDFMKPAASLQGSFPR